MDAKRFVIGTLVGGIVLYATGYLIFDVAVAQYYANNAGSATGVARTPQLVWAVLLANLAYAALIVFTAGNRGAALSLAEGATIGAIVGFLLWSAADFVFYGTTHISNLTRTIVDPLLEIVHGGLGGVAIGAVVAGIAPARRNVQPA
jgi:hypothetical protein